MNSDPDCIFCQIVAKKKPEEILYEDELGQSSIE